MLAYEDKVPTNQAAFLVKVVQVAARLGVDPNYLMIVMWFESKLNPKARNPYTNATGLIQFMPATAVGLGTSVAALAAMTNLQQLDFVEKYYRQFGSISSRVANAGDLYLFTFYPAAAGKADSYVIFKAGSTGYAQNKVLDKDGNGAITAKDIRLMIDGYTPDFVKALQKKSPDENGGLVLASLGILALFFIKRK